MKFKSRTVEAEALIYDGTVESVQRLQSFVGDACKLSIGVDSKSLDCASVIHSKIPIGFYLVKDGNGSINLVSPDVMANNFEPDITNIAVNIGKDATAEEIADVMNDSHTCIPIETISTTDFGEVSTPGPTLVEG